MFDLKNYTISKKGFYKKFYKCQKVQLPIKKKKNRSHFILSGFKYYVLTYLNKYNVLLWSCCIVKHFCCYLGIIRVRLRTGVVVWVGLRVG